MMPRNEKVSRDDVVVGNFKNDFEKRKFRRNGRNSDIRAWNLKFTRKLDPPTTTMITT